MRHKSGRGSGLRAGRAAALAAAAAVLCSAACLNFRPAIEAPDLQVESLVLCRAVAPEGELLAPVGRQDEFRPEDESAVCFVRLKSVPADTWLRWKWYSPDGKLARDSGPVPVDAAGSYLETVTAYDRLDFAPEPAARPVGQWTVVLFIEDALAARRTFRIIDMPLEQDGAKNIVLVIG